MASSPLSSTEVKLLLVISYFITIEVLFFIRVSLPYEDYQSALEYLKCEEPGVDPRSPCIRQFGNYFVIYVSTVYYFMVQLIPSVCLVFVVDFSAIAVAIKMTIKKIYTITTAYFKSHE